MSEATPNHRLSADLEFEVVSEGAPQPATPEVPDIAPAPKGFETPPAKRPLKKGVLDRDQYMLTPKQRERYNQFRQQGIDDKVARQLAVALVKSGWDESQHPRDKDGKFGEGGGGGSDDGPHTPAADPSKSDVGSGPGEAGARGKPFGAMSTRDHAKEAAKRLAQAAKAKASGNEKKHAEHMEAAKAHGDAAKAGLANKKEVSDAEYHAARTQVLSAYTKGGVDLQNRIKAAMPSHIRDALDAGNRAIGRMERAEDRAVTKGGPGSGPHPGEGRKQAVAQVKERVKQLRAEGEHARAGALQNKVAQMAQRLAEGSLKKSYAAHFVSSAKEALPTQYFNQLRSNARARAGGTASGMARRALGDAGKAQLMERRQALQAELAQLEADLKKTAPLAQEVAVDAPVQLAPKEKKRRKLLAAKLADEALAAVKSCPAGKERVAVAVSGQVFKSLQPDWKRIVHSVVYAPGDVDAHGDYMHAEDIEKMAHDAMRSGLYVNHEHTAGAIEADIVESYIAPQDFQLELPSGEPYHIPKGSHVMAMHVWGDEPWQKIQKGEYVGYSLEGTALRDVE